jgi:hypothetical protein
VQTIDLSDTAAENVPDDVVWKAKAAFKQRVREDVLVQVWDSLLDEGAPNWHHHLRFEHPRMWIELSVYPKPSWSSLHGVMHPAVPLRVELQSEGTDRTLIAEVTRHAFRIEQIPHGLVRLRFVGPELMSPVSTEWFYI